MLEVRLIGTFDIKCDGKRVIISSRTAQSLFAYLILNAGTSYRREKLAGMFWPDATEDKARAYLRYELWRLRKAIHANEFLLSDDIGIAFNSSMIYWLDSEVLENLKDTTAADELMVALSTCQGELLPGFYDEWIVLEREHLQAVYEQKITYLLELLESEKRWSDILEWAERWISFGHGPEAAFRTLMVAYDALGDRAKVASTYQRCVQALRELDLEPSESTRALAFKHSSKLNIPIPLTSFIGRETELKEVAALLSKSRMVTLTGSGGVGKTRLAIHVVADVLDRFPDGVWFLDLAPLSDPTLVPRVVITTLGLIEPAGRSPVMILTDFLQPRHVLLILDNCEHLIKACAQLAEMLLQSCPNLYILATSREALRIHGELPYRVPSLEVPKRHIEFAIDELSNIESVKLFTARAQIVLPGFALSPQNALEIAQICQRLDGIPLAIELAVARANVLTVGQILKRLDDRFPLLTGGLRTSLPRHQTLRATIEWSYDLLSEHERILFRRLAVFAGGWTLEAAEDVCSGNGIEYSNILDMLSQLVNKSLVLVDTVMGEKRYRRLETIRQFAREKLLETNELAQLRDRHLIYFLKKAEEIEPYLMGMEQSEWMDYLDLELENIRLALEWSVSNNRAEQAIELFASLGWFWIVHCHFQEGEEWCKKVMVLKETVSKSTQAKALRWASWLRYVKGDIPAAISLHQESLAFYRELGDMKEASTTLQFLGVLEEERGNPMQARSLLQESLDISRQVNNKSAIPRVLIHLGHFSEMEGDMVMAQRYYEEALAICRQIGEGHLTMVVLRTIGSFVLEHEDSLQARPYFKESLEIGIKLKNIRTIAGTFLSFSAILCTEERYSESAQLQGFAETLFKESESLTEAHLAEIKRVGEIPKKHLGADSYRKEFDIGKTLKLEEAVEIALKQPE